MTQSAGAAILSRTVGRRQLALAWAVVLGLLFPFVVLTSATAAAPAARPATSNGQRPSSGTLTLTVNTIGDAVAVAPLDDGICDTGLVSGQPNGVCSLRAAIMKANHWPGGPVTIILPAQAPGAAYALDIPRSGLDDETTGDLNITHTLTILGGGASQTIVDGTGAQDRVFWIEADGVVTISAVTIQSGNVSSRVDSGGGIVNFTTLTLINSRVVGNHADQGAGGGVFSASPFLTVYSSTIGNNTAEEGGGIEVTYGDSIEIASTISGNQATGYNGGGGLALVLGGATLVNSTVSGNRAAFDGGGIALHGHFDVLNLYNATIADNVADSNLDGIGTGGGIYNTPVETGTVVLRNSLIAGNFASAKFASSYIGLPQDCSGGLNSGGYNLIEVKPNQCVLTAGLHDQVNVPAMIGPLRDNGGPTLTQALLTGSPAINAGNPGGCAGLAAAILVTDQRGSPRPATGLKSLVCDIGAFEYQRTYLPPHFLFLPLVMR